jgi:hypothetical protein
MQDHYEGSEFVNILVFLHASFNSCIVSMLRWWKEAQSE